MADRRSLITGGVALGTMTWIAPSIVTLDRVAAAQGSGFAEPPIVGDGAILIPAPAGNAEGTDSLMSNANTFVWLEAEGTVLDSNLIVNRVSEGIFGGIADQHETIPAGTQICSWYVHGDHVKPRGTLTGSIRFGAAQIVGVIYRTDQLNASSHLQNHDTVYSPADPMEGRDTMSLNLSPSANALSWSMSFGSGLDGIRILTTCPN